MFSSSSSSSSSSWWGSKVASVSGVWGGVREVAEGLGEKLDVVTSSLQHALLLDTPARPPALPPWEDLGPSAGPSSLSEEARRSLRALIMALAKNRRNFLEGPPEGTAFEFKLEDHLRVAEVAVEADPHLSQIRFNLVPLHISEQEFWRNYFYRVKLLKEAHGLAVASPSAGTSASGSGGGSEGSTSRTVAPSQQPAGAAQSASSSTEAQTDDEADAFLAELEALESQETSIGSSLPVTAQITAAGVSPLPSVGLDLNDSIAPDGARIGAPSIAPTPASTEVWTDDSKWEQELELELQAELEGLEEST